MTTRGIRGATTIEVDTEENILTYTQELLLKIQTANPDLKPGDIGSAVFTVTGDITAAFPARAARMIGWDQVPLICAQEIPVEGSLPRCIRILIHWNTEKNQADIQHVYLHKAAQLRPDLNSQI